MIMDLRIIQRTHPLVEVQIGRYRHLRQTQGRRRFTDTGIDLFDMTDGTCLYQFDGLLELLAGALLASYLQDPTVLTHGTHHSQTLCDRISQRLLAINILA